MNILVTGSWKYTQEQKIQLEQLGHKLINMVDEKGIVPCPYEQIEGVICNALFLHHPIEMFTSLRYIQLTSAGLERVPMDYIKKNGITIYNARGVYSIPMAEYAVCGVLQLYKRSLFFYRNQLNKTWEKNRTLTELCGKTVCIIGCGSVGNECATRFGAFGCKIIGIDLYPRENAAYEHIFPLDKLKGLASDMDVLVLTLPLTQHTQHMINEEIFNAMKKGSVLVNIARGGIVDTEALIHALKTKLGGAVLDVFEEEPLSDNNVLWEMENVIISPHNSFVSEENSKRLSDLIFANLNRER